MKVIESDNAGNLLKYVNKKLPNNKGISTLIDDNPLLHELFQLLGYIISVVAARAQHAVEC